MAAMQPTGGRDTIPPTAKQTLIGNRFAFSRASVVQPFALQPGAPVNQPMIGKS
jgi:hypothetical protein